MATFYGTVLTDEEDKRLAALFGKQGLNTMAEGCRAVWREAMADRDEEHRCGTCRDEGLPCEECLQKYHDRDPEGLYLYLCPRCGYEGISSPSYWQGHGSCEPDMPWEEFHNVHAISFDENTTGRDIWEAILQGP